MADTKISALATAAPVAGTEEFGVNDSGVSRKFTVNELRDFLGVVKAALSADYTNTATTGTEVTGLSVTLAAGTYRFSYFLVIRSAATGTGIDLGINFTGTQTALAFVMHFVDTGTTTTAGVVDDTVTGDAGEQMLAGAANRVVSTTVPNLNVLTGVAAANVDNFLEVKGVVVVTVSGDLELWAASDVATSEVRVQAGSNVKITRMA